VSWSTNSVNAGDWFTVLIYGHPTTIDVVWTNLTSGWSVTSTFSKSLDLNTTMGTDANAAWLGFGTLGGTTYHVTNVSLKVLTPARTDVLIYGASITAGQGAEPIQDAWAYRVKRFLNLAGTNTVVYASGGDQTDTALKLLPELYLYKAPAVILGGDFLGNDALFGVPAATYQANYTNLVNALAATNSTTVAHLLPTARTLNGTPGYNECATFLVSTYRGKTVDTFTLLNTGTQSSAGFNGLNNYYTPNNVNQAGDYVHPNNKGHAAIANAVLQFLGFDPL
jgi:lysophospholipase L1-like esterase